MAPLKKQRTVYVCQACGYVSPKWLGRCNECQAWSTLHERAAPPSAPSRQGAYARASNEAPIALGALQHTQERRKTSGIPALDHVLGGGLVQGALILVGGDPGIGKSTLLLQVFGALSQAGERVLYVTGEESHRQIALRAERLGLDAQGLLVFAETQLEAIKAAVDDVRPTVLVIDSIQTMAVAALEGAAGSVAQIRAVTQELMRLAKAGNIITFVVGHVTKEGTLAGPKLMEHMVDTVLYFEGEKSGPYRILRAHKNRFGSAQEIAVFEMQAKGLVAVDNPSALFLSQRAEGPGATVVTSMEGSRPIVLEVQALVVPVYHGGTPRRTSTGFDTQRVAMLCAVLQARAGIDVSAADIFVNVTGGVKVSEPAADLGVILALASARRNVAIRHGWVAIGEVGLAGEVRAASQLSTRLAEVGRLGFEKALVPQADVERLKGASPIMVTGLRHVRQALALCGLVDNT